MPRFTPAAVPMLVVLATLLGVRVGAEQADLVAAGATWRYLDDGSDQGAAWRLPAFDDASWASGPAELGYGDGDEATVVGFGPDASHKFITTYFRRSFAVADPAALASLSLSVRRDDGAVVYLNAQEVFRSSMPAGPVGFQTPATVAVGGAAERAWLTTPLAASALVAGINVVAVEIHQSSGGSSDISFDLRLTGTTSGGAPVVSRGPYLQMGTPQSVVVRWRTDQTCVGRVRYGTVAGSSGSFADEPGSTLEHEVALGGLQPATRYFYSVGTATEVLAGGDIGASFVTSPPAGPPHTVRVWVLGDSGTASTEARAVRDAYHAWSGGKAPDLWLMLGDNAYSSGTDAQYQAAVFDTYPDMLRRSVLWPTLGNHDTAQSQSPSPALPYFQIFSLPAAGEAGGVPSGTEKYYSFDVANIHFVCLDSQSSSRTSTATGSMLDWLQRDLAATTQRWVVAYFHHPPYTKGSHHSDVETQLREMREHVTPLLEQGGVDLVLAGHSHSYERSFLLDGHYGPSSTLADSMKLDPGDGRPAGDGVYEKPGFVPAPHAGAVYVVMGSSGQASGGALDHPAMAVSSPTLGSLVLDVEGGRLDASFLRSDGGTGDTFTIAKDLLPPKAPTGLVAAVTSGDAVALTWSDASRFEDGFVIERRGPLAGWHTVAVEPADATSHLDSGLAPGTQYAYRVHAFNAAGQSPSSSEATAVTPCIEVVQLAGPSFAVREDAGIATVTLTRNGCTSAAVSVSYATADGTALAGMDYAPAGGTLTFAPGQAGAAFTVAIIDDGAAEGVESFGVTLSAPTGGAVLGGARTALVEISDDETQRAISARRLPRRH